LLVVVNRSNTLDVRVQCWGQPAREARNAQQVVLQDEYPAPSRRIHHGDAYGLDREALTSVAGKRMGSLGYDARG